VPYFGEPGQNIICSWEMRDRSMRNGTELAREIPLTDRLTARNLSDRFSGVQIPRIFVPVLGVVCTLRNGV